MSDKEEDRTPDQPDRPDQPDQPDQQEAENTPSETENDAKEETESLAGEQAAETSTDIQIEAPAEPLSDMGLEPEGSSDTETLTVFEPGHSPADELEQTLAETLDAANTQRKVSGPWHKRYWLALNTPLFPRYHYRTLLPLLGLLLISGMLYGLYWMQASNPVAITPDPQPDPEISLRFFDIEMRGRSEGTDFFSIWADEIEVSKDQINVIFKKRENKPHGEFRNLKDWEKKEDAPEEFPPRKRSMIWEANEADYNTRTQNLTMRDQVKVITDTQDIIVTNEMRWIKFSETLASPSKTYVTTSKGTYMESNQLKVETKDKALYLEGQVYIEMNIGKDQQINVDSLDGDDD